MRCTWVCMKKKSSVQREFGFANWGGKRRGAGRKPRGERAGVGHDTREKTCARYPVLLTLRLRAGLPSLRANDSHRLLRAAFAAASGEGFRVVEYSVQSNHLHLIAEASSAARLSRGMIGLSVRVARGLNRLWRRAGSVFADRFHSRVLRTPRAVRTALVYVLQNARKHGAWIARRPDAYSSGDGFEGWRETTSGKGAESRSGDATPAWVGRARSWLLSIGWRRHGRIGVTEAPAGARR